VCSVIHKHSHSFWNKEKLPEQWKESVTVPIYNKGVKTDCNNYQGILLLSTTHTLLCSILLSRLTPDLDEIIGYHQCGFNYRSCNLCS
jgi:hypothetical protein